MYWLEFLMRPGTRQLENVRRIWQRSCRRLVNLKFYSNNVTLFRCFVSRVLEWFYRRSSSIDVLTFTSQPYNRIETLHNMYCTHNIYCASHSSGFSAGQSISTLQVVSTRSNVCTIIVQTTSALTSGIFFKLLWYSMTHLIISDSVNNSLMNNETRQNVLLHIG